MLCLRVVEDDRKVGAIGLFLKHCLEGRDHRQFFAGARGGQNQRQSFEISLLGDETIATFRVRAPAERHERKVLSDVRQA